MLHQKRRRSKNVSSVESSRGRASQRERSHGVDLWRLWDPSVCRPRHVGGLFDCGYPGRALAYRSAQLCRWYLRTKRASLPEASGSLAEMVDRPFFEPLYELFRVYGGIFKLSFGPQSFVIVSDPQLMREILSTSAEKYSKGILSDILEFVMGNGLIPANGEIWMKRRRAILPSLHKAFIERMMGMFTECTNRGLERLHTASEEGQSVEMEAFFSRLALDIIGRAVFNHDFDATTHDDPVIQVILPFFCLFAEHLDVTGSVCCVT